MTRCECGCGQPAPIADRTDTSRGYVRGEPRRFINGHQGQSIYRVDPSTGCWLWQGALSRGYGRLRVGGGKRPYAHRVFWERKYGPVPPRRELDHLCRNRACVNPDHLEPVTAAENVRRGLLCTLPDAAIEEIRAARAQGGRFWGAKQLAEKWGTSPQYVSRLGRGLVRA